MSDASEQPGAGAAAPDRAERPASRYSVSAGTCPPWCQEEHPRGDPTHLRKASGSVGAVAATPYVVVYLLQGRTERRPTIRLSVIPDHESDNASTTLTAAQTRTVALLVGPALGAAMREIADLAQAHRAWKPPA